MWWQCFCSSPQYHTQEGGCCPSSSNCISPRKAPGAHPVVGGLVAKSRRVSDWVGLRPGELCLAALLQPHGVTGQEEAHAFAESGRCGEKTEHWQPKTGQVCC